MFSKTNLIGLLALSSAASVAGVNYMDCGTAQRADVVGFFKSELEGLLDIPDATVAKFPEGCLPNGAATSVYGGFFPVEIAGSAGLEIDVKFWTYDGLSNVHSISVMKGSCGALQCVAYADATDMGDGTTPNMEATVTFPLMTNERYYVFVAVAKATGATVPHMGFDVATLESECKLQRMEEILSTFDGTEEGAVGICTECEESINGTTTTFTYACTDACEKCYDATYNLAYTGEGPLCYKETRQTTMSFEAGQLSGQDVRYCYNFTADGTVLCDDGASSGACPLEINGVACASCTAEVGQAGCAFSNSGYGTFKLDCSNIEGFGVADKCAGTGFDANPTLMRYGVLTDIFLANQAPTVPDILATAGTCEYGTEGLPVSTYPPTPDPDPKVELALDERTDGFSVVEDQTVQYSVSVGGMKGILRCELESEDGDVDMYMAVDNPATNPELLNCFSDQFDSNEVCSVVVMDNMEVNVNLFGYKNATGVRVKCEFTDVEDARTFDVGVGERSSQFDLQANEYRFYVLDVPEGTNRVMCQTRTDDGDLDLFIRVGDMPMPFVEGLYDCQAITESGEEYCEVNNAELASGASVYILMQGFNNVTDGQLTCEPVLREPGATLTADDAEFLDLDETKKHFDLLENEVRLFYVEVPQGTMHVWCNTESDQGEIDDVNKTSQDVDLFLRLMDVPVLGTEEFNYENSQFDDESSGPTTQETVEWMWSDGSPDTVTTVYIAVSAWYATSDVRINCNAIVPATADSSEFIGDDRTEDYDLVQGQEKGYYFDTEWYTGRITCRTETDEGDVAIYMRRREFPNRFGSYDASSDRSYGNEEAILYYDGRGSEEETAYIIVYAKTNVQGGEITCTFEYSDPFLDYLQCEIEKQNAQDELDDLDDDIVADSNVDDLVDWDCGDF